MSIYGNRYTLRSEADPGRLRELAADVDARMREAASVGGGMGADRIAVLVALNLADELVRERDARDQEREGVRSQSGRILSILNDGLGNEGSEGVS
ncbi:MAG: cell division protein ZapA [Candidatus Krumholzibacteriia bacterium]